MSNKFDTLYEDMKNFYQKSTSGKMSLATVTTLTEHGMEIVQTGKQFKNMKGPEKKELVLGVVNELVTDILDDPELVGGKISSSTKKAILTGLDMAPHMIDAAAGFAKLFKGKKGKICGCI